MRIQQQRNAVVSTMTLGTLRRFAASCMHGSSIRKAAADCRNDAAICCVWTRVCLDVCGLNDSRLVS